MASFSIRNARALAGGHNPHQQTTMETKNTYLKYGYTPMTREQLLNKALGLKK